MNNKKRLLITGVSGHLGSNLAFCLKERFDILGLFHSRQIKFQGILSSAANLHSLDLIQPIVRRFDPQIVIHCAAQANVDACEIDPLKASEDNVLSTQNLVRSLDCGKAKLIHISTDLVYEGTKGAYSETDKVNPVNFYGKTKLDSETEALKKEGALVLRTNFFGWGMPHRLSLAQWVVKELAAKRPIQGFIDAYFSALYTFDLASLICGMINRDLKGVYNCGSSTAISKYEFAVQLAKKAGLDTSLITPISVDHFPFKAKRAKNLSLNVFKLSQDLGVLLPTSEESINHFVADLNKNYPSSWQEMV